MSNLFDQIKLLFENQLYSNVVALVKYKFPVSLICKSSFQNLRITY